MEEKLDDLSDLELLALSESSEPALETLLRRYFRLVKACAHSFYLIGAEESDLQQEGWIGLLAAVRSFSPDKDANFPAYAALCIRRRMISAVRTDRAEKNAMLNDAVPLSPFSEDAVCDSPEAVYLSKEKTEDFMSRLEAQLSTFEKSVLRLYLEGWSGREIAQKLSRPARSADNAIQRIRAKAAKIAAK